MEIFIKKRGDETLLCSSSESGYQEGGLVNSLPLLGFDAPGKTFSNSLLLG
jgi:hypothetical protein